MSLINNSLDYFALQNSLQQQANSQLSARLLGMGVCDGVFNQGIPQPQPEYPKPTELTREKLLLLLP